LRSASYPKWESRYVDLPHIQLGFDCDRKCSRSAQPYASIIFYYGSHSASFIWKGADPVPKYENMIKDKFGKNPKLKDADKVEIA